MAIGRNVTININDISPSANTAYVDAGKENKVYNKAQVNELVEDLREGTLGSISPSQTLPQLNALSDGNYYAAEAGDYAFGVTVPNGWQYRFNKVGNIWKTLTKVQIPMQDLTSLENRVTENENKVDDFIENFSVEVDQEFSETSTNAIATKLVTPLNKLLKGFEKPIYQKTDIIQNATNSGIFGSAGTVLASASCKYILNFPTGGKTHLDYAHSNYSTDTHTFIWGVKNDDSKVLILARRASPPESVILAYGSDIDISMYKALNFAYYPTRGSNQYIRIYSKNEEDIIGYTSEDGAVKDYIDSMKPNTDKEIVLATSKDMVGRLINSNNGDGLNGSYLGFRNILLPKNTIKLRYTGIKTNSASTLDFAPLIGVKFDGTHETILPLTISTTNFEETVEISVPKGKYYAVSYCSRATSNAKIVAIVDEIDLTEQKRKEYLFSNNNESVQKIPRLASAEAGWYSTFTQNTCVTRGEFTFGFFVEGSSAALVVFRINNNTGEVVYNNLLINNSFRRSAADGHNAYSITISRDGYIIISGNCHNEKPDSAISDKPLDISKFNNWDYTGATDVSYPRFALSPNGDLFAFYRRGGSGNGNTYFAKFNDDIKQFNTPIILIDAISENAGNPYLQTPVIDRNGVIKIAFGFRRSASDWGTMTGLYYIESADNGVTWRKSDGIPISLPVKRSTAERVLTINENSGYVNQNGACVDANNTFLTTMTQRRTVDGKTTDWIVLIKQNSSGWTVDYIFDTGVMAESSGIYTGIYGRPMVFVNRMNEPIVLFNSTLQDRSIIAINTKTKERKILTSGVHHSVVCDNEYARDFFIFKTLFINGQSTTKIPQTANRYFELFIYESKLL